MTAIPVTILRSVMDLGRTTAASGGWVNRNNLEAHLLGLLSLEELLKRTVSGHKAAIVDSMGAS